MTLHREGYTIMAGTLLLVLMTARVSYVFLGNGVLFYAIVAVLVVLLYLIIQFFRVPKREIQGTEGDVVSPADGKVVVIEEVEEPEYFKGKRIQVSVFMSPLNVHVNWTPVAGEVVYSKYHPGKYLVAWHPKSSTENERTTLVLKTIRGKEILFRQIAGALARRICFYAKDGMRYEKGQEFGFIKFGSRVDIFLPLDAKINVAIGQKVKGKQSIIAQI